MAADGVSRKGAKEPLDPLEPIDDARLPRWNRLAGPGPDQGWAGWVIESPKELKEPIEATLPRRKLPGRAGRSLSRTVLRESGGQRQFVNNRRSTCGEPLCSYAQLCDR